MTIEEAKELFMSFDGFEYHMWHDATAQYEEFRDLHIPDTVKEEWRQEIISNLFAQLEKEPKDQKYWVYVDVLLKVIVASKMNIEKNSKHFLDVLDGCDWMDSHIKTVLIENMAGRTESLEYGGINFIGTHTDLLDQLHSVLDKFSKFSCSDSERKRYVTALDTMQRAFAKVEANQK